MAHRTGMPVTLTTAHDDEARPDDHLDSGGVGTGGCREFPLDSASDLDFETGQEQFALGSLWEGGFVDGATKFPLRPEPGKDNDPALTPRDVDRVNFVYFGKHVDNTSGRG
jgi:hypothetical protein